MSPRRPSTVRSSAASACRLPRGAKPLGQRNLSLQPERSAMIQATGPQLGVGSAYLSGRGWVAKSRVEGKQRQPGSRPAGISRKERSRGISHLQVRAPEEGRPLR